MTVQNVFFFPNSKRFLFDENRRAILELNRINYSGARGERRDVVRGGTDAGRWRGIPEEKSLESSPLPPPLPVGR